MSLTRAGVPGDAATEDRVLVLVLVLVLVVRGAAGDRAPDQIGQI
jgi:hypothetical protein